MKKKSFLVNLLISIIIGCIIAVLCFTNVFEKFELKLYDGLLHLTKDPPMSEKVLAVEIDDNDIDKLGDWPWSRDILGDTILRLKELGAEQAVFDIEYISTSPKAVASNAESNINNEIYKTEVLSSDMLSALAKTLSERNYPVSEAPKLAGDMINENLYPAYTDLYNYVEQNVAFDNDEYFGKCLQFFGNSWLTVNNQDLGYTSITDDDVNYIRNRMLNYNMSDPNNFTLVDNDFTFESTYDGIGKGFTPALHTMIKRAQGVGFTNSNVDSDGTRRGMELMYEYDGKYLPQLVFGPLLHTLDTNKLIRNKNSLTICDALMPGSSERIDIKIPLDEHGRMLINWQHESDNNAKSENHMGCNYITVYPVRQLDNLEKNIKENIYRLYDEYTVIDEEGYPLDYVTEAANLVESYNQLEDFKTYLLNKCNGYDEEGRAEEQILPEEYDQYFDARTAYFDEVKAFAASDYSQDVSTILKTAFGITDDSDEGNTNYEFYANLMDLFNTIHEDIELYQSYFKELQDKVKGRYCIIGQTAASTTDIGAIPFKKQYPNVLIHINILNTLLTQNFIKSYPWYWAFIISLIVSLLLTTLSGASTAKQNIIGGAVRLLVMAAFILMFVLFKVYIPMLTSVFIFLIFDFLTGVIYRYLQSSKEKKFITEIASSFANKDTVAQLRANPDAFKTEGEKKCITALFSDIQKFSTFTESCSKIYGDEGPTKLVQILNEYLGAMSNEILFNNGTIDKYEGDAIISMFGAPDMLKLHNKEEWAYLCIDSAIRMKKGEVKFNQTHEDLYKPVEITNKDGNKEIIQLQPLQTRIGINSGDAFVGLMGSKTETFSKLNYTMMGDTVNLASRLEGANKAYLSWILCSEDTWKLANTGINEGKITVRRFDKVRVVGRTTPVQLYNIVGFTEEIDIDTKRQLEIFEAALDKYLAKDFVNAGKLFVEASKIGNGDPTSIVFAERCKKYIKEGVPEDWDGVMNLLSK